MPEVVGREKLAGEPFVNEQSLQIFVKLPGPQSTLIVIQRQSDRLEKSMKTLGRPVINGKIFLAGKYWIPKKGQDSKMEAQQKGFGILYENGEDLSVLYDVN